MRSISQIYSEAIATRNNYLQLTELNTGRSNSKMSIINLMTYVVAVCIYTYEAVLESFELRVANMLIQRINGTPQWYVAMAKMFQYNSALGVGDELVFDENTLKVQYSKIDETHRIVTQSAWQSNKDGQSITLKIAKDNTNSTEINNGIPYTNLSNAELAAFNEFIQNIKFIGSEVYCISCPGDIVTIYADKNNPIYYNDRYVNAGQAMEAIKNNYIKFNKEFQFNGMLYYKDLLNVIYNTANIVNVSSGIKIYVKQWDNSKGGYSDAVELTNMLELKSGYIKFANGSVVTINADNITLMPASSAELTM